MAEASRKKERVKNAHKPLTSSKSCTGRLQREENDRPSMMRSSGDLSSGRNNLNLPEDLPPRKRSYSMPLSLEATEVAKSLKRMSDSLTASYIMKDKNSQRPRRHTVASPRDNDQDRRSFHFDSRNNCLDELNEEELPDYQRGTSV